MPRGEKIFVEVDGETMCLKHACNRLGLSFKAIQHRITYRGYSFEQAIAEPIRPAPKSKRKRIKVNGVVYSLPEAAKVQGISISTVRRRLKLGWSIPRALKLKPKIGRNQHSTTYPPSR